MSLLSWFGKDTQADMIRAVIVVVAKDLMMDDDDDDDDGGINVLDTKY